MISKMSLQARTCEGDRLNPKNYLSTGSLSQGLIDRFGSTKSCIADRDGGSGWHKVMSLALQRELQLKAAASKTVSAAAAAASSY